MKILISTIILGLSPFLWAGDPERPTAPPPGVDLVLTKGEAPRVFFQKRLEQTACQGRLKTAKAEVKRLTKEIATMRANKERDDLIDDKGKTLMEERTKLLGEMQECGECATQEIETRVLDFRTHKETWFISDGSCQLPIDNSTPEGKTKLKKAFDLVSDSLTHAKRYPNPNGGFNNVLEFQVMDGSTLKPDVDAFPPSPLSLAIWVRGPRALRLMMYYPMEAKYETTTTNGLSEFHLEFASFEPKSKVTYPTVTDFTPSGKPVGLIPLLLRRVVGRWYLTSDGYFRYFTAAMLPANLSTNALKEQGRSVLNDTLTELSARGQWE